MATYRGEAEDLAKRGQFAPALTRARQISDAWFACQALSYVARFAAEAEFDQVAAEAIAKAWEAGDPYRTVAVSAWPLRALIERGRHDAADDALPKLLHHSFDIKPPNSRSEALFGLFQATRPGREKTWRAVFGYLVEASISCGYWRQRRNLRDAIEMILDDPVLARSTFERIPEGKCRRQVARFIGRMWPRKPRDYFW